MDYPDPTGHRCYPDNAGEAAAADNCNNSIADMFGDHTTGDLFDLVWRGGGKGVGVGVRGGTLEVEEPPVSCLRSSPPFRPSEDEMAESLYATIIGEEHYYGGGDGGWTDNNGWHVPFEKSSETSTETEATSVEKKNAKLRTAEGMATKETGSDSTSKTQKTAGVRSHHGATHKLTEKRRRCEINEKLKTLKHLVPGCDKSNYTSTLEHTIQYMKTLQQQVQALAGGPSRPAAVQPQYVPPGPLVTLAPMVVLGPSPMVPLGSALLLPHYPASVVMVPAATTPMYPATPRLAPPPGSLGRDRAGSGSMSWKK